MTYSYKTVKIISPDWQSEKALALDYTLCNPEEPQECFTMRVFIPKIFCPNNVIACKTLNSFIRKRKKMIDADCWHIKSLLNNNAIKYLN